MIYQTKFKEIILKKCIKHLRNKFSVVTYMKKKNITLFKTFLTSKHSHNVERKCFSSIIPISG